MLIEFSVENFLSFHERVTFSLLAAPALDAKDGKTENWFAAPGDLSLLKTAVMYGANASGKSNLVKAMAFAKHFIRTSSTESQAGDDIDVQPFLLAVGSEDEPSGFEFVWIDGGDRFRYGFAADTERIREEHLYVVPGDDGVTEIDLFHRADDDIRVDERFEEAQGLERRTRPNALFLSLVAQLNGAMAGRILRWFKEDLMIVSGLRDEKMLGYVGHQLLENRWHDEILRLAREADLGIAEITAQEPDAEVKSKLHENLPEELKKQASSVKWVSLQTHHACYDVEGNRTENVSFDFSEESEGTQKFVALAGPMLDSVANGRTLVIDEFDARLHSRLSSAIIRFFQSPSNTTNAQLVVATHDATLLDRRLLRRDQGWFTEKNRVGATRLYSLAEFDLPDGVSYEKDYLEGRYGAVPIIGDLGTKAGH